MDTRGVTEKLKGWQSRATETAQNVGQVTDRYVHENTWRAIAISAAVGALFGFLLASRGGHHEEE